MVSVRKRRSVLGQRGEESRPPKNKHPGRGEVLAALYRGDHSLASSARICLLPGVLVTHGKMPPLPSCAVLPDGAFLTTFFLRAAISTPATRLVPTLDRAAVAGAKADALRETEQTGGRDERLTAGTTRGPRFVRLTRRCTGRERMRGSWWYGSPRYVQIVSPLSIYYVQFLFLNISISGALAARRGIDGKRELTVLRKDSSIGTPRTRARQLRRRRRLMERWK